jgi:hypothetical protein
MSNVRRLPVAAPAAPVLRSQFALEEIAVGRVLVFLGPGRHGGSAGERWEVVGIRRARGWQRRDGVAAEHRFEEVELALLPQLRERRVRQAYTLAVMAHWALEE